MGKLIPEDLGLRILVRGTWTAVLAFTPCPAWAQCQQAKLEARGGRPGDHLGAAVALDGAWAAIGAPDAATVDGSTGVVYVYGRRSSGWQLQQRIVPEAGPEGMKFGYSVGISERWLVIGAPWDDSPYAESSGATYVYERHGSSWVLDQKLTYLSAQTGAQAGHSVAVDGDWLVFGIPLWDLFGGGGPGDAIVYRHLDEWQYVGSVFAGGWNGGSGLLGTSVDIDGATAISGAPQWNGPLWQPPYNWGGAAWVRHADGNLQPIGNPGDPGDRFGEAVALAGTRALIGAPGYGPSIVAGAVYAYERTASTQQSRFVCRQRLLPPERTYSGWFGRVIAMSGDEALIGAIDPHGALVAYHYLYSDGAWSLVAKLIPEESIAAGMPIALDRQSALVGNESDDGACPGLPNCDSGAAYEFQLVAGAVQYCSCTRNGPCGNAVSYGGCANSTGLGAVLQACGSTSAAADDLELECRFLPPDGVGLVIMGPRAAGEPVGDGLLCVGPGESGYFRFPGVPSSSTGSLSLGPGIVAYSHANFPVAGHIQPGQTWFFQAWFRDPQGPCAAGFNSSNGLRIEFTQ